MRTLSILAIIVIAIFSGWLWFVRGNLNFLSFSIPPVLIGICILVLIIEKEHPGYIRDYIFGGM